MSKKIMKKAGFGKEVEKVEQERCPFCGRQVKMEEFRDALSRKEFQMSGLCQACQDKIFSIGGGTNADA